VCSAPMRLSKFTRERDDRIELSPAKAISQICARGRSVAVRTPPPMAVSLNVLSTPLRVRVVPPLERKKAPERGFA
jgi:hypothetical protein